VQVPRGSWMQVGLPGVEASGWGATVENTVRVQSLFEPKQRQTN
jgi:hypothetical protein